MSKEERAEWYSKEKEPLLQAMIVREMEKLHCVSKFFNGLQGPLEIIAIHMVRWEDEVKAAYEAKKVRVKELKAEKDAKVVAAKWASCEKHVGA